MVNMIKEITALVALLMLSAVMLNNVNAEIYTESLENERYNFGETALLEGYIQEQSKFSGTLEINSICGNESKTMLFSLINLDAGEKHPFSQEFLVNKDAKDAGGSCYFAVRVEGTGGFSEEKRSGEFTVTNELRVDGDADVLTQKPGRDIVVSGVIRKANGLRVESGSVALTLSGKVYGVGLSDGAFSHRITLARDISSGEQTILIKARDLEGNEGDGEVRFRVISVPEEVIINIDKEIYRPRENLVATVFLNDQSGENVFGSSAVQLVDPNGDDALTKIVDNGNEFELFLDELTLPGVWILRAESKGFQTSKKFYVEEVKDKEIKLLEENKLIIRNIGNVNYDEPIEIELEKENGEVFRIIKETSLKPNQTITLDLNDEVPGGNYDVKVGGNLITGNVVLEGSSFENLKQNSTAGYFAMVFVFLFLIFVVVSKGRKRLGGRKVARERGKEMLLRRREGRESEDDEAVMREVNRRMGLKRTEDRVREEKKSSGERLIKASKEDIDYMLNKVKKEVPVDSENKKFDRGSPFNIFD